MRDRHRHATLAPASLFDVVCEQPDSLEVVSVREWLSRVPYMHKQISSCWMTCSVSDGETEADVFASLFGPKGLLRGTTMVLVTHGVHHLPSADKIISMDTVTIILRPCARGCHDLYARIHSRSDRFRRGQLHRAAKG
ncbi:hypothetical protein B0H15DRAFT_185857 [Mycena belliarum]|uniref:Uncharacterized protein n=1 Tax=Mycena belliarum TaxID=1033014 RepID=A0AAD6XNW2_9AGAR|nr:hypothetical protein B0H15DRAFT_185857 [Mycena belliae]